MKSVVVVRLFPKAEQALALHATLRACNAAANTVSELAWSQRTFRQYDLQKIGYGVIKAEHGLAAQAAVRTIKKVADAYVPDRKVKRTFRRDGAQPFDDRCLSWRIPETGNDGSISIWTVAGRLKGIRLRGSTDQVNLLRQYRRGESDLVYRDRKWFLYATCEIPDKAVLEPRGWLGVDLGIVNIATTSDGQRTSGRALNRVRHRSRHLRQKLQKKGTRSAKRLLKARARKEARFAENVNHRISKRIVAGPERTGRGIAIESLVGIRGRVRLRKPQRVMLHSWAFGQLRLYLGYKARRAGVPLVQVDPAYTSQTCAGCGHVDKNNRVSQALFVCSSCGVVAHADENAARNIAARGSACWAAVNRPYAA